MRKTLYVVLLLTLLAVACSGNGAGDPALAVERYMQAKVVGDADTIRSLLCAEMEHLIERESRTFDSVQDVEIEGMACSEAGDGRVTCQGTIVALYGSEETEFPLTNYRVVQEDGEWKWCGETQ